MIRIRLPLKLPAAKGFCHLAAICLWASALHAAPALTFPAPAEQTARQGSAHGSFALPVGPWADGRVERLALTGAVEHQSWRLPAMAGGTLGLMQDLSGQLVASGYAPLFDCETDFCGGFDFRFETKVLPEPEMHVDLGDFRFLAARKGTGKSADYLALLVSRAGDVGFVQLSHVGPAGSRVALAAKPVVAPVVPAAPVMPAAPVAASAATLSDALENRGNVVLEDLSFASGATALSSGPFSSLAELAAYLAAHPERAVLIVGHTDAVGPLAVNVALSRQRAQSVVDRLVADHGVDPAQISAGGVGFLAPRASNLTDEGRQKNRRVEAVLASTR